MVYFPWLPEPTSAHAATKPFEGFPHQLDANWDRHTLHHHAAHMACRQPLLPRLVPTENCSLTLREARVGWIHRWMSGSKVNYSQTQQRASVPAADGLQELHWGLVTRSRQGTAAPTYSSKSTTVNLERSTFLERSTTHMQWNHPLKDSRWGMSCLEMCPPSSLVSQDDFQSFTTKERKKQVQQTALESTTFFVIN